MRLCFLCVRRVPPVPSPVLTEAYGILRRAGFTIESVIAEELVLRPDALRPSADLYVLKSHSEFSLSVGGVLADQRVLMLNPYAGCAAVQDKIVASQRLRRAGVPIPPAWVTGELWRLRDVAQRRYLVVKPYRGHRGAGISIVREPHALAAMEPSALPVLVQEWVPGRGEDLKVYVIGEEVFAVRKPFRAPDSFTRPGVPCAVDSQVRDIALRCGATFGLGLYGLDVIESPSGPVVVDLNYFPGYKGVPGAAQRIAEYVRAYALGELDLCFPALADIGSVSEEAPEELQARP